MLRIYFNNIRNLYLKRKIKKLFLDALDIQKTNIQALNDKDFEVSLRYASKDEIKRINKEFRDVDKATDVLSFPITDFNNEEDVKMLEKSDEVVMLGDIVICKEIAIKQSEEYGHSFKRELCFLALHGFLHLLGYDHIEKEDEEKMQKTAKIILKYNKIER